MSSAPGTPDQAPAALATPAWTPVLVRAAAALLLGVVITFVGDHSAAVGMIGFGACAVITAVVLLAAAAGPQRPLRLAVAAVLLLGGAASLALAGVGPAALPWTVGLTALVAGALESAVGIRARTVSPLARDQVATGALTVLLGVVVLAVPPGFVQDFRGENGVPGTLTGAVVAVGAIGAWGVLVGVLLTIAAIGLRPRRVADPVPAAAGGQGAARS